MAYRGEDLDLRTAQTWTVSAGDLGAEPVPSPNGPRGGYRNGPILVDETLLACSNHAFDIALAHRSAEVRLEHLLHAMTRIEAAAEALESRGVRVAALRRESATIIASEIPVGLASAKGQPRRSEEFAEALRLAGIHAGRRGDAAGVDDVLFVLLDQRHELASAALLARHAPRLLPPREVIEPPPRYAPASAYERYYRVDAPRSWRAEPHVGSTDAMQNSRIDALEQLVRGLSADLAAERQAMSSLLKELNRTASAQRDDQGRLQSDLFDRLQSIEQVVSGARTAGTDGGSLADGQSDQVALALMDVAQRLDQIEGAVRTSQGIDGAWLSERIVEAVDLRPLANRLDVIEEALLGRDADVERLRALETAVERSSQIVDGFDSTLKAAISSSGGGAAAIEPSKLALLTSAVENQTPAFAEIARDLGDRLTAVETALNGEIETAVAKHKAYAADLAEVHDALMKLNQNQHTLAGSIDQWRTDAAGDVASIATRLANLDRDNERPIETLNALTAHMDKMNRMFIERYHRRNRFWYWLFGTDDWLGASWPSQTKAVVAEAERTKAPDAN